MCTQHVRLQQKLLNKALKKGKIKAFEKEKRGQKDFGKKRAVKESFVERENV